MCEGGTLQLQEGKPVAYARRASTPAEQNYAQIEKELLAVLFGCDKFDVFTFGRFIKIEGDHKPLQTIVRKPIALAPKRLQRMLLKLQQYNFELLYRKGSDMHIADTLSRLKHDTLSQSCFEKDIETICHCNFKLAVTRKSRPCRGTLRVLMKQIAA